MILAPQTLNHWSKLDRLLLTPLFLDSLLFQVQIVGLSTLMLPGMESRKVVVWVGISVILKVVTRSSSLLTVTLLPQPL